MIDEDLFTLIEKEFILPTSNSPGYLVDQLLKK